MKIRPRTGSPCLAITVPNGNVSFLILNSNRRLNLEDHERNNGHLCIKSSLSLYSSSCFA